MPQRWSRHFDTTVAIVENFKSILAALNEVSGESSVHTGDAIAEATGLLSVMQSIRFRFSASLMKTVLGIIAPADKILQSRASDLNQAMSLVDVVKEEITKLRCDEMFADCLHIAEGK
jgi:hypothetical protein